MLADAAHAVGSKLYVLGGQWDRLTVATFPAQHPSMALVLVIKVEYTEAPKTYQLNIELTLDGQPVGVKAAGAMAMGHAAGLAPGAAQYTPLAIPFNNVTFGAPGRYEWVITADTKELGRVPLEVVQGLVLGQPASAAPQQPGEDA